jgi:hypothetical protein
MACVIVSERAPTADTVVQIFAAFYKAGILRSIHQEISKKHLNGAA